MKKIFAYTVTAVLLGAVVMLFPLRIYFMEQSEEGPIAGTAPYLRTLSELEGTQASNDTYNSDTLRTTQPTDPFVGILAISFLVAVVAYFLFRRRRPDSAYRYSQYLLHPYLTTVVLFSVQSVLKRRIIHIISN